MRRCAKLCTAGRALVWIATSCTATACDEVADPRPAANEVAVASARALSDAFTEVTEGVSPSVVSLHVVAEEEVAAIPRELRDALPFLIPLPEGDGGVRIRHGDASGVVVRSDGYILTTNHAVADATRIDVVLSDGQRHLAEVVGTDPETDLAVIRIDAEDLIPATFGDSSDVRIGEWVLAIGAPFGLESTVTAGVVSATGRSNLGVNAIEDYVQTDASINPGNSGGPLVDLDGRVVGINCMIVGRASGIGFAVPSNLARRVADDLIETGTVVRSHIGVGFEPLTPEMAERLQLTDLAGAVIVEVLPDGPASEGGIIPGDVVVEVDGVPLADGRDLLRIVLAADPGTLLRLGVVRRGERMSLPVLTARRPPWAVPSASPHPGKLAPPVGEQSAGPMCQSGPGERT